MARASSARSPARMPAKSVERGLGAACGPVQHETSSKRSPAESRRRDEAGSPGVAAPSAWGQARARLIACRRSHPQGAVAPACSRAATLPRVRRSEQGCTRGGVAMTELPVPQLSEDAWLAIAGGLALVVLVFAWRAVRDLPTWARLLARLVLIAIVLTPLALLSLVGPPPAPAPPPPRHRGAMPPPISRAARPSARAPCARIWACTPSGCARRARGRRTRRP